MKGKEKRKLSGYIGFAVLTILYIASIIIVPRVSQSGEMLVIGNTRLPMSAFAGVMSTMANLGIVHGQVTVGYVLDLLESLALATNFEQVLVVDEEIALLRIFDLGDVAHLVQEESLP